MGNASAKILASNVRALMQARGWKLVETARRSGVGKSTLANIVNYRDHGDTHASIHTVDLLAHAFGVETTLLLKAPESGKPPDSIRLDAPLLASCVRAAFTAFRERGTLPDDAQIAAAAAFLYRRVNDGATLKQAGDTVSAELARLGMKPAAFPARLPRGKDFGKAGKGTVGRRGVRAASHAGTKPKHTDGSAP